MSLMWILGFVFVPSGILLTLCVLSGSRFLEKRGYQFCQVRIQLCDICHPRVVSAILVFCFAILLHETWKLYRISSSASAAGGICAVDGGGGGLGTASTGMECRSYKWRHERNWWIVFFNFCVWGILWRMSAIVEHLYSKLEQLRQVSEKQQKAST